MLSCEPKVSLYVVTFGSFNLPSKSFFLASEAPSFLINFSSMLMNIFIMLG